MRAGLQRLFSIDLRSLAAFRVGIATMLLTDLAQRSRDLVAHYSELGVLPRAAFAEHPIGRFLPLVSLHAHGPLAWQVGLFVLAALLAVALLVGWRTRLAAFGSWLLLVSLQNRNPLVSYGGDIVLVLLCFWSLFLPLGARWSLDARRGRGAAPVARCVFSWGSAGLLVQIAALHWFSAFHKRGPEWIPEGSAIFYALHVDKLARPLGVWLRSHDVLLPPLTYGVVLLELVGPILLFVPWRFPALRLLAVAGFVAFHVGIGLSMDLVLFSWISALSMAAFLPPGFWERAGAGLGPRRFAPATPTEAGGVGLGLPRAANVAAGAALAFVLGWNVVTLRPAWRQAVDEHAVLRLVVFPGLMLRLGQTWAMFAPQPPKDTLWHVVQGVLEDGRKVDLLRDRETSPGFGKPAARGDYYPNGRWERLFANAPENGYVYAYRDLGSWYCRHWNSDPRHPVKLARVAIWSRQEATAPDGERTLSAPRLLARQRCSPEQGSGTLTEPGDD